MIKSSQFRPDHFTRPLVQTWFVIPVAIVSGCLVCSIVGNYEQNCALSISLSEKLWRLTGRATACCCNFRWIACFADQLFLRPNSSWHQSLLSCSVTSPGNQQSSWQEVFHTIAMVWTLMFWHSRYLIHLNLNVFVVLLHINLTNSTKFRQTKRRSTANIVM